VQIQCRDNDIVTEKYDKDTGTSWMQWQVIKEIRQIKRAHETKLQDVTLTEKRGD